MVQHDTRADADGAALRIKITDTAIIAGKINNQAFTDGAAGQAGARAARNHRDTRLRGRLNDGAGLGRASRKCHC